jgi:ABC-type bacteriocin/lantibiotic exporter with double-glycine peptidase domain
LFLAIDGLLLLGMMVIFKMYSKNGTKTAIIESKSKYKVASWIESIGHHSTGFRLGSQQIAPLESERLTSVWLENREEHFSVFIRQYGSTQVFQITMSILVLLLGGQLVLDGELTIGQFVAAEFVVTNALIGFTKFMDKMDTIYDLLASLDKLGTVLDLDVEPIDGLGTSHHNSTLVQVENLRLMDMPDSLTHSFEPDTVNLVNVPFSISTYQLAEALIGVRKPFEGHVLHNNIEVQHLCLTDRYNGLHLLCNDDIFEGSIYDNITMGDVRIQSTQIWEILEQIGVSEFLDRKQDGLEIQMPTANPLLNSGIALARCLLTTHRLIISVDFFTGLPLYVQDRWLRLLRVHGATCIVLEGDGFRSKFPFHSTTQLTTRVVAS